MWLVVLFTRPPFIGGLLSLAALLVSPAAGACSLRCYTGAADEEWASLDNSWPGSRPSLDAEGPLLLVSSTEYGALELRVNGERRAFEERSISGDGPCAEQLVSISPTEPWEVGDLVEVGRPSAMHSPDDPGAREQGAWTVYKEVGAPRAREDVPLHINVEWIPQWEFSFSDTLCSSIRLSPFTSFGYATIVVDAASGDFDFSAQATVILPDATEYRSIAYNRYGLSYYGGQLHGTPESDLVLHLPLTRSDSAVECFHLTLFDERLTPFYDEELCPSLELAHRFFERVTAHLRPLAPPPTIEEADVAGCAWNGQSTTKGAWWYGLFIGMGGFLQLRRMRRG